jgi:hypothetical protein
VSLNRLQGNIPATWTKLQEMSSLSLAGNMFSCAVPNLLATLPLLRHL